MIGRAGERAALGELARLLGIETSYEDFEGERRFAEVDTILAVLATLGVELPSAAGAADALRETLGRLWRRVLPPVVVAWDGAPVRLGLRLPAALAEARIVARVTPAEPGASGSEPRRFSFTAAEAPAARSASVEGERFVRRFPMLPGGFPEGYHELEVEVGRRRARSRLISAPRRVSAAPGSGGERSWGVFVPLYALKSGRDRGAGDLAERERLARWTGELGGRFVGTLPLLASHPDALGSPYSPLSRLFWNELFVDLHAVPELEGADDARRELASGGAELEAARASSLVDYAAVARGKRRVLRACHAALEREGGRRREELGRFRERRPEVAAFARHLAFLEEEGRPPPEGEAVACDPERAAYHEYAQWVAQEQLEDVARRSARAEVSLYLDLPLGAHPEGFDVRARPGEFLRGASSGAPPDAFFRGGQSWGLPPPHPDGIRESGLAYLRDSVRHHLRVARMLRIDHVMAFHHLWVVPAGADAAAGVYLRYRPEEHYAVLALEARRAGATIVGEDLGTVPRTVRAALDRHGLERMYVLPFELDAARAEPLAPVPAGALACLGTHDTVPFAGFWEGDDLARGDSASAPEAPGDPASRREASRRRRALVRVLADRGLLEEPDPPAGRALDACLAHLAASPARHVLVALEDLWLERRSQNVPGTTERDHPNWRRKCEHTIEELERTEDVRARLRRVGEVRARGRVG